MGRRGSLRYQVRNTFDSMLRIGHSKHDDRQAGKDTGIYIYSWDTYRTYLKHCIYFTDWCRENHGCRTLDQCREHAPEWLSGRVTAGTYSPYTLKMEASALAKLYGCRAEDFGVDLPRRNRADITRSRGQAVRDAHFSETRNAELVTFCRCTGLRRHELEMLEGPVPLRQDSGGVWWMKVTAGTKGGRPREIPITGPSEDVEAVLRRLRATERGSRVWPAGIPVHADIHAYRAEYATRVYLAHARPPEVCRREPFFNEQHSSGRGGKRPGWDRDSVYWCRGDRRGEWMDKQAMLAASRALGHNRTSVVGEHYIRLQG